MINVHEKYLSVFSVFITTMALTLITVTFAAAHGTKNKELISPSELSKQLSIYKVIDLRLSNEYEESHIPETLHLSLEELSQKGLLAIGVVPQDKVVLYSTSESSAKKGKLLLSVLGYQDVRILAGGFTHWVEDGYNVEKGPAQNVQGQTLKDKEEILKIEPGSYDFGIIKKSNGTVSTTFIVENNSEDEISITEITTSCGCTSAKLDSNLLPPGEQRKLTVHFDPNYHKEPEGKFSRTVFLNTSKGTEEQAIIMVEISE